MTSTRLTDINTRQRAALLKMNKQFFEGLTLCLAVAVVFAAAIPALERVSLITQEERTW